MKPLREQRGRLYRLIKRGGLVDDVEREDIEEDAVVRDDEDEAR
jgi:protein-arginine kinase activator protein McsA